MRNKRGKVVLIAACLLIRLAAMHASSAPAQADQNFKLTFQ
jgi:hypothetical protein